MEGSDNWFSSGRRDRNESRWRYAGGIVPIAGPRGPRRAPFLGEWGICSRYRTQVAPKTGRPLMPVACPIISRRFQPFRGFLGGWQSRLDQTHFRPELADTFIRSASIRGPAPAEVRADQRTRVTEQLPGCGTCRFIRRFATVWCGSERIPSSSGRPPVLRRCGSETCGRRNGRWRKMFVLS